MANISPGERHEFKELASAYERTTATELDTAIRHNDMLDQASRQGTTPRTGPRGRRPQRSLTGCAPHRDQLSGLLGSGLSWQLSATLPGGRISITREVCFASCLAPAFATCFAAFELRAISGLRVPNATSPRCRWVRKCDGRIGLPALGLIAIQSLAYFALAAAMQFPLASPASASHFSVATL